MDKLIYDLIDTRKKDNKNGVTRPDFMQMLLDVRYEDGNPMPDKLIRDELVNIFFAGHDTTSSALVWTLYLLRQHPDIAQKVKEEARKVFSNGLPDFDQMKELSYTRQVIQESLRIYPPSPLVARCPIEDEFNHSFLNTIAI